MRYTPSQYYYYGARSFRTEHCVGTIFITILGTQALTLNAERSFAFGALCMMTFDAFMEPAAVTLGYWTWVSVRMRFLAEIPPALAFHAYWGQLLYFTLVNLR